MPKTNLVVRLGSLGDVVLATGVLRAWQKRLEADFVFLTKPAFAPVLFNHPAIKKIISVPEHALQASGWTSFCRCLARELGHMELIDLHATLRSAILRAIWPYRTYTFPKLALTRRIYSRTGSRYFQKRLLDTDVPGRYFQALYQRPPDSREVQPLIHLDSKEKLQAKQILAVSSTQKGTIALHPYATHPTKAWPRQYWLELIAKLEEKGWNWLILGQDADPMLPGNSRDLTSQTDIRQTCAVLERCSALITGDSGPMHLARAVNTPVLALFGPTTREWGFYPTGKQDRVLEIDLPCRPCSLHGRTQNACPAPCMSRIQPVQVLDTLAGLLQNSSRHIL